MSTQFAELCLALQDFAAPIESRIASPERLESLFYRCGWQVPLDTATFEAVDQALDLRTTLASFITLADEIRGRLAAPEGEFTQSDATSLIERATALLRRLGNLSLNGSESLPAPLNDAAFWREIGAHLLSELLDEYLQAYQPAIYSMLRLSGALRFESVTPTGPSRRAYTRTTFDWRRLGNALREPLATLRQTYGWGDTAQGFAHRAAFDAIDDTLHAAGISVSRLASSIVRARTTPAVSAVIEDGVDGLEVTLVDGIAASNRGRHQFGARLLAARTSGASVPTGFAIAPIVRGAASSTLALAAGMQLRWRAAADLTGLAGISVFPNGASLTADAPALDASVELFTNDTTPRYLLGNARTTRLEIRGPSAEFALSTTDELPEIKLRLSAQGAGDEPGCKIVIPLGEADGFIAETAGTHALELGFSPELVWSNRSGLTLNGRPNFDLDIGIHQALGPAMIESLHLSLSPGDDRERANLGLEISASVRATLGPVTAQLHRVGFRAGFDFDASSKNLGFADVSAGFKPPSGVGLSIDALGVLSGGGFLFHDEARQLYGGAMQLSLHDQLTLTGFGLIATRMPDGSRGFSLIVFITAENFHPIPLGLGFNLLGVGGMVAINRTFDEEAIRQGLKTGTLATLMFPRDPLGNVPALIQALTTAFPARRGSYLLGLLVKIGWLTPPLVLLDLALILELGGRERLLVLGRIRAQLPSPQNELIRLNMETLGVIDFDAGTAALDAVLVDSRLSYKFPITGSAALRARFGSASDANFILAAGGLNPHFKRPRGFPALDRLAISLSSGKNPRLVCEAYFAITSNTVQFGARAWLYASAAGFSVEGDVGFDVLVQIAPLYFIADYHARVQLKRGSHNLFMVEVKGELEGPRPLRVSGKATFKILWFGFSVRFDTTLVHGEPPPMPPAVNVLAELTKALSTPESWSIQRPAHYPHGVSLRSLPAGSGLVLDPLGQLAVRQQVVPLNTGQDVDIFAGAPVAGERRFTLTATMGRVSLIPSPLQASFAPAQYFAMSDDEKLSAPPYQSMDAGYVFGTAETVINAQTIVPAPLGYRTIVLPPSAASAAASASAVATTAQPPSYTLTPEQLEKFSRSGAVARAPARRTGRARFQSPVVTTGDSPPAASIARGASFKPQRWTILPIDGRGPAASVAPDVRTWSEYQAALNKLNRGGARWQLVPTYELEA